MTWDPTGIVVSDAFRDYVEKLRNTASDGEKVRSGNDKSTHQRQQREQRMNINIKKTGLATLLALAVLTSMAVPAVAQSGNELADKSVTVDSDTESVYLEVTNTSGDALNYTVYGISDGLSDEVDSGTISSADENDTARQTFAVNATEYDEYRVVVTEDASDSDEESADNIEVGTTVNQAGGGGAFFAGAGGGLLTVTNGIIAFAVFGVTYVIGLWDPVKERLAEE
ncbi:hypothetical protein [Halorubrum halophilum]|uniref:hypothetical protein n=1 Tax=Halorubrum halophilum TaxID=413816 RepID=UPI000ACC1E82|nr:hypothetical protein [Halorubrum halophilum]